MTGRDFGPEWRILEHLAFGSADADRDDMFADLLRAEVNWGELLEQALRHRVLTLLAHEVVAGRHASALPLRVAEHLGNVLSLNRYRRGVWYGEVRRVLDAFARAGVETAVRKGAAYESTLYGGNGSRWLGDIDVLVRPADRDVVTDLLRALGYERGLYDFDTGEIVPFRRDELIRYRLNPDHLPTESLATGDELVPVIEVDVANSLTWARSDYQVPVEDALTGLRRHPVTGIDGLTVPRMTPVYEFLDTVLHLFREAWFEWWLDKEQDVDLMKFGDVLRLWRANHAMLRAELADTVRHHQLVAPVCWVLEHLDRLHGGSVVAEAGLTGQTDAAFLASAGGDGRNWHGDMRQRLHAKDRGALFASV